MAFRMRYWIAVVAAAGLLVADWRLPPESMTPVAVRRVSDEANERHARLAAELRVATESLVRLRWADSLSALVTAETDGVLVTAPGASVMPGGMLERLEEHVQASVAEATEGTPAMAFGFVYQDPRHARPAGTLAGRVRIETMVGERDGRPYCLQLHLYAAIPDIEARIGRAELGRLYAMMGEQQSTSRQSAVGPCRPYLRHGAPGVGIQAWLESGALALAFGAGAPPDRPYPFWLDRRMAFGLRMMDVSPLADRCLAGLADGCLDALRAPGWEGGFAATDVEVARRTPAVGLGSRPKLQTWLPDFAYLLYDLEEDFGREAFGRFWTSEEEVEVAFREAFGMEMGDWTVRWADETVGTRPPGPTIPKSASTGGLLTIALLLGVAYAQTRRRRIA